MLPAGPERFFPRDPEPSREEDRLLVPHAERAHALQLPHESRGEGKPRRLAVPPVAEEEGGQLLEGVHQREAVDAAAGPPGLRVFQPQEDRGGGETLPPPGGPGPPPP